MTAEAASAKIASIHGTEQFVGGLERSENSEQPCEQIVDAWSLVIEVVCVWDPAVENRHGPRRERAFVPIDGLSPIQDC
jgi:hypothetical protein